MSDLSINAFEDNLDAELSVVPSALMSRIEKVCFQDVPVGANPEGAADHWQ